MADVYSLSVRADTSDIRRGRNDLDRFGKQAGSTRSTVTELGKSLVIFTAAATATSVALGAMAVKSIKAAKEIVGLARVANSTVPEFQKMAFGAKTVGVEAGQLSGILKDMSDRVGDFLTTGGGEMADFFEKIAPQVGVTAEQFRELSGPDALQLFVSSLEKANVSQNEMIFFMEAMSSESTRLLPLLRNNGAAMAEQAKQAEALGIALSEVDAQNITDAAEQIDRVGSVFGAFSDQIAAEISPLVSALSRQFLDFTEDAGGVDEAVSDLSETVDVATDVAAALAIVVAGRLTSALAASGGALAFNAVQAVRVQLALGRMGGASTTAAAGMLAMGGAARAASASMALLGGPVGVALIAAGSLYYFRDALFATRVELGEAGREVRGFTEGLEDMTAAQVENIRSSLAEQMRENKIAIAEAGVELDRLKEKQNSQNVVYQGRPGAATAQIGNAENEIARLTKLGGVIQEELQKVETRSESLSKSASAAAAATAKAGVADASKAIKQELEFLRTQNALIESGVSATEAEIIVREKKTQLQLQSKGLTAAEAAEYVALGNAIDDAREAEEKQASINREASGIAASLMSEEASIIASYERRRDIILDSTNTTGTARNNLLVQLENEKNEKINDLNAGFWEQYLESAEVTMSDFQKLTSQVANNFTSSFGNAFESVIFDFESVEDAGKKMLETLLRSTVNALAQMAAQWLIYQAVQAASGSAAGAASATALSAEAAALQQVAAVGAYASTAAIPIVGPALAPAAAGSAIATTTPFVAAATGLAATMGTAMAGARAMGGSVTGGGSYMVGENGPEVVTMGGSGVVTPSSVGGGGMSVVINDQTTTSTGHDVQTQETTGPEGQRQMQVTIRDTVRRQVMQGEFDRQLGSKFDLKSKGRRV